MNGKDKIIKALNAKDYKEVSASYSKPKWNGWDFEGGWDVTYDVEYTDESICDQINGISYDGDNFLGAVEAGFILTDKLSDVLKIIELMPVNVILELTEDNI